MKVIIISLLLFVLLMMNCQSIHSQISDLKLIDALPIEYEEPVEPSGLTFYNGYFYTISDDHDNFIFKLEILKDKVVLNPEIKFEPPSIEGFNKFDFEGITCDEKSNFYLSSENALRILKVSPDGRHVSWLSESLKEYGESKGFFRVENAGLEGIALLKPSQFVLCAERQPRGILKLDFNENPASVEIFHVNEARPKISEQRFPDFTGLVVYNGSIYVLERAAGIISRIDFQGDSIKLSKLWSYESIETSDSLRYSDTLFTCGEGLYIDADYVYVILDNNRDSRFLNPEDHRPLLLIMQRP